MSDPRAPGSPSPKSMRWRARYAPRGPWLESCDGVKVWAEDWFTARDRWCALLGTERDEIDVKQMREERDDG